MSTQVFDNVRVDDVFYSTIAQARDATGITVQDASGTALLQVSTGTVLLFGDQRQENNGIQKQVYLNQRNVGSSAGTFTVPVINVTLPPGAYSGFKVFVTITNAAGSLVKFDEYIGNATWTAGGGVANVWQLASTPASCLAASVACVADATSASLGCCERERWLSDLHSESCTDRVWILSRQCYSERLLRTLWLEAGNPVGASVMIPRKLMPVVRIGVVLQ